jgi:hypothetical protein
MSPEEAARATGGHTLSAASAQVGCAAGIDGRRPILADNGCPAYLPVLVSRLNSNRWGLPPFM